MPELWLNFKDEYGDIKRVLVEKERFTIGRTSENDLGVPYNNISRQHAVIEQVEDTFLVSDCGSSNGTTLNDRTVYEPMKIYNGDLLNVGGWLEIDIEIIAKDESAAVSEPAAENSAESGAENKADEKAAGASAASSSKAAGASANSDSSFSFKWLLLAPALVLLFLFIGGGILLATGGFGGDKPNNPPKKEVDISSKGDDEDEKDTPTPEKSKTPSPVESSTPSTNPTASNSPGGTSTPSGSTPGSTTPDSPETPSNPKVTDDREKVKASSALLLRRIATKDPNAFLTTQQATFVTNKINTLKNSSAAIAENLKDAKKNSSKIVELAKSKNLTPQFLTVAALTELGTTRGDVVGKATEILEKLGELSREFGGELADDSLLVIAGTTQSKDGELLNTITKSSTEFPNSPVRSVWFLQQKNKLSPPQFDKVLRFLAIGTISQNPKDFGVNAEAVSF